MVIINPNPFIPRTGDDWINPNPPYIDPYPDTTGTFNIYQEHKKWMERHIKDVKKGILITFEGSEEPIFIATDDKCWSKIMEAIKDEPRKKHK